MAHKKAGGSTRNGRRKHFKKQAGHRQSFTNVEITKIAEGK